MDAKSLAISIVDGVSSIPLDIYLGIERTIQDIGAGDGRKNTQRRNFNDNSRMLKAIGKVYRDRNEIRKIIDIIINDALVKLPDETLSKIINKVMGKGVELGTRQAAIFLLSGYFSAKIVQGKLGNIFIKIIFRFYTGIILSGVVAQGVLARAADSSRKLRHKNPALWQMLYILDYDMLFFLFEEPLEKFIELSDILRNDPEKAERFICEVDSI